MSKLTIRGVVLIKDGEFAVAGVTVIARVPVSLISTDEDSHRGETLELGRAVTTTDGAFLIETDEQDEQVNRAACVISSCNDFKFTVACFDDEETLLHETEPLSYHDDLTVNIDLPEPDAVPTRADWQEFARLMTDYQTVQLSDLAEELATLGHRGIFRNWSVTRRLSVLRHLEQAYLDPTNIFSNSQIPLRFSQLLNDVEVDRLRGQFRREERADFLNALNVSVERARKIGGWRELDLIGNPEAFKRGDHLIGVNEFIAVGPVIIDQFTWLRSPSIGYRDYLRDRWVEALRWEPQLGQPPLEVATKHTLIQRLNNRFHQDFTAHDTTDQPANRVLIPILLSILKKPVGEDYGLAIPAADIDPQGALSDRDYVDYLISVSGIKLEELEKRYRLNLHRSDLETSNPVQQNIDTLQRFFTDSYQSIADPFFVKPDRKPGTTELLIIKPVAEGSGPFFLEFEEWLARDEVFYPENHYDPRATFWFAVNDQHKPKNKVFAKSMPLAEAAEHSMTNIKFVPEQSAYNYAVTKWQWVRNLMELHDLVWAAHNDAKSLNYIGAEQKYGLAHYYAFKLRRLLSMSKTGWWEFDEAKVANEQKKFDVSTLDKLQQYERLYHLHFWHGDLLSGSDEVTDKWWGDQGNTIFPYPRNRRHVAYLIDHLYFRVLPACLSEVLLAQGRYAEAVKYLVGPADANTVKQVVGPAGFNIFKADTTHDPFTGMAIGMVRHTINGSLPYGSSSDVTNFPTPAPLTQFPTNRGELGYYKLKLGNTTLEWADALYRSNQPESIMRARELYKAVIFLHDEDPEITPNWARRGVTGLTFPAKKSKRNPAIVSQVERARLGFFQINSGLNFYGLSPNHVPPVRYRVLKEGADRFAAGARGAQTDFLNYMQQLDQLTVNEMTARTMVAKATSAIAIAQEQQKTVEGHAAEVQRQVDGIKAQIEAKRKEVAKTDSFFSQLWDFAGGMKDSVWKLGELAFAGEGVAQAASAQSITTGDIMKLAMKFGTSGNMGATAASLSSSIAVAGPFAAFIYAGVSSMSSMAEKAAKPVNELKHLENVALPAAKALLELKKREVTIAQHTQNIAKADWQLGKDLLTFYAQRFLNRSFLTSMAEFSNRLMRRYLDLAGKTAWFAERALAFEQDRELGIIGFDYFPRNLRGVTGADLLQLHLAELEAARIQGLTQTIPVKQTISLAREFPAQLGQLKKTGVCTFSTTESPLRLVYPGVYGYRLRNVTIAATYADAIQPHRGLFSNPGVSLVTRDRMGPPHVLVRYPDALPVSEFRMDRDMWVFDLPDETLLPFEGSGIETIWELMLSKIGNANGFESLTDVMITFDMRAHYSAALEKQHLAALPTTAHRSLLLSGRTLNPMVLPTFNEEGGLITFEFDMAKAARNTNETSRKTQNFVLVAVGVSDDPFTATFSSSNPAQDEEITFEKGVAMSNTGVLAGGNGGVPLPLSTFSGLNVDQTFTLEIDADANPGTDFTELREVLLLAEYEATF